MQNGAVWLDVHYEASNPQRLVQLVAANVFPGPNGIYGLWYYGHVNWSELYAHY